MTDRENSPLCVTCRHFQPAMAGGRGQACMHPNNASLVDGLPETPASLLRIPGARCGSAGRWHERGPSISDAKLRADTAVRYANYVRRGGWMWDGKWVHG